MARYYDIDKLADMIRAKADTLIGEGKTAFLYVAKWLDLLPAADVAPKSEVEELEAECERQYEQAKADILANMADGGTSCHWCIDEHKAQAKADVAREIFEEIEKIRLKEIHKCETLRERENEVSQRKYWEGGYNSLRQLSYWFAELKKKYTEGRE